jgi:hypothetical protein
MGQYCIYHAILIPEKIGQYRTMEKRGYPSKGELDRLFYSTWGRVHQKGGLPLLLERDQNTHQNTERRVPVEYH